MRTPQVPSIVRAAAAALAGIVLAAPAPGAAAEPRFRGLGLSAGATAMSDDGTVLVGQDFDHAYRWTQATGVRDLGTLPGAVRGPGTYSAPYDVSADGSTVVGYALDHLGRQEAFRWTSAGGMQGLGSTVFWDSATAVSGDGSVIVGDSGGKAFLWSRDGGMRFLGSLGEGQYATANGVSGDGSIVLGWRSSPAGGEAFIWDAAHGMRGVRQVLVGDHGFDLSGWADVTATAISDDGRTLVGYGINPSGTGEVWIATIPEPAAPGLLAAGGALLVARRRRRHAPPFDRGGHVL